MARLTRVGHSTRRVVFILVLPCLVDACAWLCIVPVSSLAGSEPAVRPTSYFGMDIEDAKQYPWLEYSVWQDQEWVRIYTPGQPQREWQRVTDPSGGTGEHVRHGPFATGSIKDTNAFCLKGSPSLRIIPVINHSERCRIPMQFLLRKCSPMTLLFLTVIARLLHNSRQWRHS